MKARLTARENDDFVARKASTLSALEHPVLHSLVFGEDIQRQGMIPIEVTAKSVCVL